MEKARKQYSLWKDAPLPENLKKEAIAIQGDPEEIYDRFCRDMTFGTSGLRGKMGIGTNRINEIVIKRATMGVADYLLSKHEKPKVVIGYDTRKNSAAYAEETARTLAARGIDSYVFMQPVPVPAVSFGIRYMGADGGIMITASHNPKIFNGYKVYNSEGYQVTGEVADDIQSRIEAVDYFDEIPESTENIEVLSDEVGEKFKLQILSEMPFNNDRICNEELKIVYTPLNGAGRNYVADVLSRSGFSQVTVVPSQAEPDSTFATCPVPNPEKITAYNEAFKVLDETKGDIIIATDPDSDRVGAALIHDGTKVLISGNQMGILMLDYMTKFKEIKPDSFIVRSIVSTPLVDRIAERHGIKVIKTLTGFKYIGEIISLNDREEKDAGSCFFGFEESCGFLPVPFIRDKDGISSALLIAEMAAYYKSRGKNLMERLSEIFDEYEVCIDRSRSYAFEGLEGEEKRRKVMEFFRSDMGALHGVTVTDKIDYLKDDTGLPKADVTELVFDTGEHAIIRPSGTEPLIKVYLFVKSASSPAAEAIKKTMDAFQ